MLKQEELKSWKKIQETKKKTDDIFYLKKRNEDFIKMVFIFLMIFFKQLVIFTIFVKKHVHTSVI